MSETVTGKSGAKSSRIPRFDLIPREAIVALANRFEMGLENYSKDNWRKGIADKDYVLGRIAHVIDHASKLVEKLEGRIADDGDDDVGAILWAGAFLSCAVPACKAKQQNQRPDSVGKEDDRWDKT